MYPAIPGCGSAAPAPAAHARHPQQHQPSPGSFHPVEMIESQQHPEDVSPFARIHPVVGRQPAPSKAAAATAAQQHRPPTAAEGMTAYAAPYPPVYVDRPGCGQHVVAMPALCMSSTPYAVGQEPCACSAGWALFGMGWILPVCWVVGVCLPLCSHNAHDRRAAFASGTMLVIYAIIIAVLIVMASSQNSQWHEHAYAYSAAASVCGPACGSPRP